MINLCQKCIVYARQPRFVYSACGPFTRHKEIIKEFKRTGNINLLYRNALDKACFKHDAAYAKYKDVENRLIADDKLKIVHMISLVILNMMVIKEV